MQYLYYLFDVFRHVQRTVLSQYLPYSLCSPSYNCIYCLDKLPYLTSVTVKVSQETDI